MLQILAVGVGGFVGAITRYGISTWVDAQAGGPLPAGTLTVNLVGCLLIGASLAAVESNPALAAYKPLVVTGLLGSLTTFSTFSSETLGLLRDGNYGLAALYAGGSAVLGLGAVAVGRALAG